MALDTQTIEGEWQRSTVPNLLGGLQLGVEPLSIEAEESPNLINVYELKGKLVGSTGYSQLGQALTTGPRKTWIFRKKNGSIEQLGFTNTAVYKWNDTLAAWQPIPGAVHTTAVNAEVAGATVIEVVSTTGLAGGDTVYIVLDNGAIHTSTLASVAAGVSITLNTAIPVGRSVAIGALVYERLILIGTNAKAISVVTYTAVDWVVFANGFDIVKRYDGTDIADVPNLPSTGNTIAHTVAVFENMLLLSNTVEGGTAFPNRIRNADVGDPTNWTTGTAGFEDLYTPGGAVLRLEGLGPYMIAYREDTITRGEFIGAADNTFDWFDTVPGTGILATDAVANAVDFHIFMSTDDVYLYRGGLSLESIGGGIWDKLFGTDGELNLTNPLISLIYVKPEHEVFVIYSTQGSLFMNRIARLQVDTKKWFYRVIPHKFAGVGQFLHPLTSDAWNVQVGNWLVDPGPWVSRAGAGQSPVLMFGGQETVQYFYMWDFVNETDNGLAIPFRVETKDFTAREDFIRLDRFLLYYMCNTDIVVEYSIDGGDTWENMGVLEARAKVGFDSISKQFIGQSARFALSGYAPGFKMAHFGFVHATESEWSS